MNPAIEITNLTKSYGAEHPALQGLDLTVSSGEIFGFLGPNGAGKTTTIRILLAFCTASSGTARLFGGPPDHPETRRRIGYLPEVADYYDFLKADELLRFYGTLCGMSRDDQKRRIPEVLDQVGLPDTGRKRIAQFSKGMKQRLGLAQALLADPDLLILDEPMSGLDPLGRRRVRDIIRELGERGKTIFFSSHELSEAEMIADKFAILKDGRTCWQGTPADIAGSGDTNLERVFLSVISDNAQGGEQ